MGDVVAQYIWENTEYSWMQGTLPWLPPHLLGYSFNPTSDRRVRKKQTVPDAWSWSIQYTDTSTAL